VGLLDRVSRGKVAGPVRLVVYGPAGVGKSSFAAGAPSPLFFDYEGRTGHLDVARVRPQSWDETLALLRELLANPGEFKTVVFDTLDHLEPLIHKHVCQQNGWSNIEEPGYGKGYEPAINEWYRLLAAMDALHAKGINVIMLAHHRVGNFKNPSGEDYNVCSLRLKGGIGSRANPSELIRDRAELVGFAHFEDFAKKAKSDPKAKAITTGDRVLTFSHHPAFETKKGVPMADETKLSWAAFAEALAKANAA
jgi:hypothetical protein